MTRLVRDPDHGALQPLLVSRRFDCHDLFWFGFLPDVAPLRWRYQVADMQCKCACTAPFHTGCVLHGPPREDGDQAKAAASVWEVTRRSWRMWWRIRRELLAAHVKRVGEDWMTLPGDGGDSTTRRLVTTSTSARFAGSSSWSQRRSTRDGSQGSNVNTQCSVKSLGTRASGNGTVDTIGHGCGRCRGSPTHGACRDVPRPPAEAPAVISWHNSWKLRRNSGRWAVQNKRQKLNPTLQPSRTTAF